MKRLFINIAILLVLPLLLTQCREGLGFFERFAKNVHVPGDEIDTEDEDDADNVDWNAALGYVFDTSVIPEIHIIVSQNQWDSLLAAYDKNPGTSDFVKCDVEYIKGNKTIQVSKAGLRLKGNTSRRRPQDTEGYFHHCHYGIDFHKYVKDPDHTVNGVRRVDLKWFKDDPTYVREIYCYDLFRRYGVWTAINDVYAQVCIKVGLPGLNYLGVYGMLEHIDKNYLRARKKQFGDEDGNLWKCRWPAHLMDAADGNFGVDDNSSSHTYELKTNKKEGFNAAKAQMQDFIRNLNSKTGAAFNEWIASVMDVELFLKTYAVNVAVGMWDDYWCNSNNYYLYFNSTDPAKYKVFFIPYDYDNTLGTSGIIDAGRQDPMNWGNDSYPLMVKILQNPTWANKYKGYLRELCGNGGLFNWEQSHARISAWQDSIQGFVSNDTGEDMEIYDSPAGWGNVPQYRIMSDGSNNYFKVKAAAVAAMK